MIRSFKDKETERIWQRNLSRRLPPDLLTRGWRKLAMLNAAHSLEDLLVFPGNRLEALKGDRAG